MKATDQLRRDHDRILAMLPVLERMCALLDGGTQVEVEHLERILEFIRVFADYGHHGKEEDLLFPAMEEAGVPRKGGPIGVMLAEHEEGRGYVRAMSEAIPAYAQGDSGAAARVVENGRKYVVLLQQHIEKENGVLFPMADMRLSGEQQDELERRFEAVEVERLGPGKRQQFDALLERLSGVYLR